LIDNVNVSGRWYYDSENVANDDIDTSIEKIMLKDELINEILISKNNLLEKAINKKLMDEKYSMDIPMIEEYKYIKNNNKTQKVLRIPTKYCEKLNNDYYINYYF
jgi:hypothetical protein